MILQIPGLGMCKSTYSHNNTGYEVGYLNYNTCGSLHTNSLEKWPPTVKGIYRYPVKLYGWDFECLPNNHKHCHNSVPKWDHVYSQQPLWDLHLYPFLPPSFQYVINSKHDTPEPQITHPQTRAMFQEKVLRVSSLYFHIPNWLMKRLVSTTSLH